MLQTGVADRPMHHLNSRVGPVPATADSESDSKQKEKMDATQRTRQSTGEVQRLLCKGPQGSAV